MFFLHSKNASNKNEDDIFSCWVTATKFVFISVFTLFITIILLDQYAKNGVDIAWH